MILFSVMFWAGWDDEMNDGSFADANTGEVLRKEDGYWPFYPGEPNGGRFENCVVVWPARDAWNDFNCKQRAYGFCNMQPRPRFVLRGMLSLL